MLGKMRDKKPVADIEGRFTGICSMSEAEIEARAQKILADANLGEEVYRQLNELKREREIDKPKEYSGITNVCRMYEQVFGRPQSVFYPACADDISPLRGFPNSRVTFLDPDDASVEIMRRAGIPILHQGIETYKGKHDLIMLINPAFKASLALPCLERGGRIIANNYLGTAEDLKYLGLPMIGGFDEKEGELIFVPGSRIGTLDNCFVFGGKN